MSPDRKRVLVIGGETPVGRAIAVGLAEKGADIAIASLTPETQAEFAINSALNEVWAIGRKGVALPLDASDDAQLRVALERADAGVGVIDAVVTVVDEFDAARFRAVFPDREVLAVTGESDAAAALAEVTQAVNL